MTHKQKRIFFNWLQKHGALKAYKHARYHVKIEYPWESYTELSFSCPIAWSFRWEQTPEGHDYWSELDLQWQDDLWDSTH